MSTSRSRKTLHIAVRAVGYLIAFLALPVLVGAWGMKATLSGAYERPLQQEGALSPAIPVSNHEPGKPTAVVVMSNEGSQVTDVLAPYEVLAAADAFNLYTAAPTKELVPLGGGLDVYPQLSLDELDQRLAGKAPDLIVVPAMPGARRAGGAGPVADWLRKHAAGAAVVLSVCNGAEVLGEAGLLDGRRVTANWAGISAYSKRYPKAEWVRGLRYVEDGSLISTAGITSGVNGTLRVVSKFLGDAAAQDLARQIGYPDQRLDASPEIPANRLSFSDTTLFVLSSSYRWNKPSIAVAVTGGVGEIELASVIDVYPGQVHTADVTTLATERQREAVTSKHGLTFLPRHGLDDASVPDRLLVPGHGEAAAPAPALQNWARSHRIEPEHVHAASVGRFPFDATLIDLAGVEGGAVARFNAKALEYPTQGLNLPAGSWPFALLLLPLAIGSAGLAMVIALGRWLTRRLVARGSRHGSSADPGLRTHSPERALARSTH